MIDTCYLDLDGVLADFVSSALAVHGKSLVRSEVAWNFYNQIGFTKENEHLFWEPMGYDFWEGLNKTDEADWIVSIVEKYFGYRVVIVTSPCETKGCLEGKVAWIRKHFPAYRRRYSICPAKELLTSPNKLLIDDSEYNVAKFSEEPHGGKSILVPRPWNRFRGICDENGNFKLFFLEEWIEFYLKRPSNNGGN